MKSLGGGGRKKMNHSSLGVSFRSKPKFPTPLFSFTSCPICSSSDSAHRPRDASPRLKYFTAVFMRRSMAENSSTSSSVTSRACFLTWLSETASLGACFLFSLSFNILTKIRHFGLRHCSSVSSVCP